MRRLAQVVSALGHPLLTTAAFILYLAAREGPRVMPVRYAVLIVMMLVVPLALWNLRQTRSGAYANFDVSVRTERTSMYAVMTGLMLSATLASWWAPVARDVRLGMICVLGMFVAAWAINRQVKVSLHAAISFFLAFAATLLDLRLAVALFACATAVTASRLVLRRHTHLELGIGSALGTAAGITLLLLA